MRFRALLAGVVVPCALWFVLPVGTIAQSRLSDVQEKIEETQQKVDAKRGSEKVLTTEISGLKKVDDFTLEMTLTDRVDPGNCFYNGNTAIYPAGEADKPEAGASGDMGYRLVRRHG